MSNWLLMTTRGDKHRMLVRLDSVQFIREGYSGKASIAFEGIEEWIGVEDSFDDVVKTINDMGEFGFESIRKVEKEEVDEEDVNPDDLECRNCRYDDVPVGGSPCKRCKKGINERDPAYKNAQVLWEKKRR